jgi:phage-related protein
VATDGRVELVFFQESDGVVPLLDWLDAIQPKARGKCRAWLAQLRDQGHDLRRPIADYLRDGIYELRIGLRGSNYRLLYFFHGREIVVVSHGLIKERIVPSKEIAVAIRRRNEFTRNPKKHTFIEKA